MQDYARPNSFGDLSSRAYAEIKCNSMMSRDLIKDFFSLPLAEGSITAGSGKVEDPEWFYFPPDTSGGILRAYVCRY